MGMFGNGLVERAPAALDSHLDNQGQANELLRAILESLETGTEQLAISDEAKDPLLQKDFPIAGIARWIIHRTAVGGEQEIKSAVELVDVLQSNPNRFGGTIVNSGETPVVLVLADARNANAGVAQIWLGPNGGSWDMRLANALWCGGVSAKLAAAGAATKLRVVEI